MNKCREEFEKLPEIQNIIRHNRLDYSENSNTYYTYDAFPTQQSEFVNGGWLTWQEQQKRIDELESRLKAVDALSRMRATTLTAFKRVDMNAEIKRKILVLKKAEQALKGGEV